MKDSAVATCCRVIFPTSDDSGDSFSASSTSLQLPELSSVAWFSEAFHSLEMVVFELWSSGAEAQLPSFAAFSEANCRSTSNRILLGALPCDCTIPFMFGCSFRP
ncbi:hypothetical protein V8G54_037030 [Vigna mungo]|uniref:Uncharacterized protein n=1 Tax=Vigna mungo TaxID=3915 RepID=A0AAQ3MHU1_VIGMU